ncbi:MAG: hypothetical protein ACXWC8_09450, partial [Limisphaerales bacterium]
LRAARPKRVWMPHYLCHSMYAPLQAAGVAYERYSLDEHFDIVDDIELREGDWLYFVNYFGLCGSQVDSVLTRFGASRVVLDNCQAFFASPRECAGNIYSPRKFFGVPDGGLLVSTYKVPPALIWDADSKQRFGHLVERLAQGAEAGYESFQRAEQTLEELEPRRMSRLTTRVLGSIDLVRTKGIRHENFETLHEKLGRWNQFPIALATPDVPMCYPFLNDLPGLREHLIASRIFVATYWKDVLQNVADGSCEASFVKNIIPLPCDQRYGKDEMLRVAQVCSDFIKRVKPG